MAVPGPFTHVHLISLRMEFHVLDQVGRGCGLNILLAHRTAVRSAFDQLVKVPDVAGFVDMHQILFFRFWCGCSGCGLEGKKALG